MSAQNGKDLLIKVDLDDTENFQTLAGLRATRISFNSAVIETTNLSSTDQWRELLSGGGVKSVALSGSGVFLDEQTDARTREIFFAGETPKYQVIIPDFGTVEGRFQLTNLEYAGQYDGEATYELSLSSAGFISFVAL